MGKIRSNIVKKTQELVFQWVFFIFFMKAAVIEIPESKLKTILAKNTIFEVN